MAEQHRIDLELKAKNLEANRIEELRQRRMEAYKDLWQCTRQWAGYVKIQNIYDDAKKFRDDLKDWHHSFSSIDSSNLLL
jgi:hypothetical protein